MGYTPAQTFGAMKRYYSEHQWRAVLHVLLALFTGGLWAFALAGWWLTGGLFGALDEQYVEEE